jgi:hypothetical protein
MKFLQTWWVPAAGLALMAVVVGVLEPGPPPSTQAETPSVRILTITIDGKQTIVPVLLQGTNITIEVK